MQPDEGIRPVWIEFLGDGSVEIEKFTGNGEIYGKDIPPGVAELLPFGEPTDVA